MKNKLFPSLELNRNYLHKLLQVFTANEIKTECSNILHITELLFITLYSKATLQRMFNAMGQKKTDQRNRMGGDRFDARLRISEEGVATANYSPDVAIDFWFHAKAGRLNCSSHSYPRQQKEPSMPKDVMDINKLTMYNLKAYK